MSSPCDVVRPTERADLELVADAIARAAPREGDALDWKMQDSAGVRRSTAFAFVQLSDELNSGRLAPGGFVTGSILFELPASEQHAVAIYESFNYLQATWELY